MTSSKHFLTVLVFLGLGLAFPLETHRPFLDSRGPVMDCDRFTTSGGDVNYSLDCTELDGQGGYPKSIAGMQVDFYHFTKNWDPNDLTIQKAISDIEEALFKTLPYYQGFGAKFDLVVILSEELIDPGTGKPDQGETQVKTGTQTPCFMRISVEADVPGTVAHEGYHCVEDANRDLIAYKYNGWWLEAVAEYYSDFFYPDHADASFTRSYVPEISLPMQSYTATIFWVFLSGYGWTFARINDLVFHIPDAQSFEKARTILSSYTDLMDAFPAFAKAFVDDTIEYNDGSAVDPVNRIGDIESLVLTLPDCASKDWGVRAESWTISTFGLLIDSGQSFTMTWNPTDAHTTLFYRLRTVNGGDWVDITSTPASMALTCEDDVAALDFIFTCTADIDFCAGVLTVLQISKLECPGDTPAATCTDQTPTSTPTSPPISNPSTSAPGQFDECLRGTWNIDIPNMQSFLRTTIAAAENDATVSNVQVKGAMTFSVSDSGSTSTFTFTNLEIDLDVNVDGLIAHESSMINGKVAADVVMGSGNRFTWTSVDASGSVKIIIAIDGVGDPTEDDEDLSQAYGTTEVIDYVCSDSVLELTGSLDGKYVWSYIFNKA